MRLEQYRDIWWAEKMEEFIGFYPREFFCFDNFSSFEVTYKGHYYPTVEHAYQSLRFAQVAPEIEKEIKKLFGT